MEKKGERNSRDERKIWGRGGGVFGCSSESKICVLNLGPHPINFLVPHFLKSPPPPDSGELKKLRKHSEVVTVGRV